MKNNKGHIDSVQGNSDYKLYTIIFIGGHGK
jgi:hypothetical protein